MRTIEQKLHGATGTLRMVFPEETAPAVLERVSLLLTELAIKQAERGGDVCGEKTGQMPVSGVHDEAS